MNRLFFGGIHPPYKKEMSTRETVLSSVVPKIAVIPLLQHAGVPCTPLVSVGDDVLMGQKIGDGEGLCVPVHASVSGKVIAIEPRLHQNGQTVECVIIENDFLDRAVELEHFDDPIELLDADRVLHHIRESGIVGMGGAAFPGSVKALSAMKNIDTLIANACECEPYITSDDMLLRTSPEQVLEGMSILSHILTPKRAVLAIEDNKKEAIEKLSSCMQKFPRLELRVLPTRYPQGSEKQLIQALAGRQIPPSGLPTAVGCVVFNVSTFAAIFRSVRMAMPLTRRVVTVTGEGVRSPRNFSVRLGTPLCDVIEAAGGLRADCRRVICGGPMMGTAQCDLSVPVVKATNAVLCLPEDKNAASDDPVCIRCGKCLGVCPMKLQPLYLYKNAMAQNVDALKKMNVTDCMECGSCAYTCPGKLPLVEKIRVGKKLVREAGAK